MLLRILAKPCRALAGLFRVRPDNKHKVTAVSYETILYDVDTVSHVATITLNRPQVMNAFNRTMCHEIRDVWHEVKSDPAVHAVVLRAAGDRAFSAGLDVRESYGQPADIWNHEDPGELLSPKWQKVWKPVVCAVQGICTAERSTSSTRQTS